MAAKRVTKSAVDWAAFAERVAPSQKDGYRKFKALNDRFLGRVHQYQENMPKIDFSFYQSRLTDKTMVAEFEKAYEKVTVPYPTDANSWAAEIEEFQGLSDAHLQNEKADVNKTLDIVKEYLKVLDTIPPFEELTHEMMKIYFPAGSIDMTNDPKMFPYTKDMQLDTPGNKMMNYCGAKPNPFAPKPSPQ